MFSKTILLVLYRLYRVPIGGHTYLKKGQFGIEFVWRSVSTINVHV